MIFEHEGLRCSCMEWSQPNVYNTISVYGMSLPMSLDFHYHGNGNTHLQLQHGNTTINIDTIKVFLVGTDFNSRIWLDHLFLRKHSAAYILWTMIRCNLFVLVGATWVITTDSYWCSVFMKMKIISTNCDHMYLATVSKWTALVLIPPKPYCNDCWSECREMNRKISHSDVQNIKCQTTWNLLQTIHLSRILRTSA